MPQRSVATSIYLTIIGLGLAFVGGIFTWLMWRSFDRANQIEHWAEVPCAILESQVESRRDDPTWPEQMPQEYRFKVLFTYEWEGEVYESNLLSLRGSKWSSSEAGASEMVSLFPAGTVAECRVNPSDPKQAVLTGESKAPGYSIWFPMLFVVGGLGIMLGAWKRPKVQ